MAHLLKAVPQHREVGPETPSRGGYQPAGRDRRGSVRFLPPPPDASGSRRCD